MPVSGRSESGVFADPTSFHFGLFAAGHGCDVGVPGVATEPVPCTCTRVGGVTTWTLRATGTLHTYDLRGHVYDGKFTVTTQSRPAAGATVDLLDNVEGRFAS